MADRPSFQELPGTRHWSGAVSPGVLSRGNTGSGVSAICRCIFPQESREWERHPQTECALAFSLGDSRAAAGGTLVAMSERTGMCVSQVTDEVLYAGLIEMQELPELVE